MVVQAITDNAERAVQVSIVVNGDRIDVISQAVATGLEEKPVTIMTLPVDSVKVMPAYGIPSVNEHSFNVTVTPAMR